MDDLISRQAAIDVLDDMMIYRQLDSDRYVISDCLNKIINLPSAQPNIVWCGECKWFKLSAYNTFGIHICGRFSGVRGEHDFCSRGEREEVGE